METSALSGSTSSKGRAYAPIGIICSGNGSLCRKLLSEAVRSTFANCAPELTPATRFEGLSLKVLDEGRVVESTSSPKEERDGVGSGSGSLDGSALTTTGDGGLDTLRSGDVGASFEAGCFPDATGVDRRRVIADAPTVASFEGFTREAEDRAGRASCAPGGDAP